MTQLQHEELDLCQLIVKIDLDLASSWLFLSINFQFRTETFLSIFLGWFEWPARFWEVQAVGNVVKISIQQPWASWNKHPRKPLQNHRYADLWAERPKEMVSRRHNKDNKNGKQLNISFSKIWWVLNDSLLDLAIGNDCVARSYRFSVPLTCTRAIIRQKVYSCTLFSKVRLCSDRKQFKLFLEKERKIDFVCCASEGHKGNKSTEAHFAEFANLVWL